MRRLDSQHEVMQALGDGARQWSLMVYSTVKVQFMPSEPAKKNICLSH